jgi:hypothetical protein
MSRLVNTEYFRDKRKSPRPRLRPVERIAQSSRDATEVWKLGLKKGTKGCVIEKGLNAYLLLRQELWKTLLSNFQRLNENGWQL